MKPFVTLAALVLGAGIVLAGGGPPVGASSGEVGPVSGPGPATQQEDVCGNFLIDVPDTGDAFDFTQACAGHDACYGDGSAVSRVACDRAFFADMMSWCRSEWSVLSRRFYECQIVAVVYYSGVRLGGWIFY